MSRDRSLAELDRIREQLDTTLQTFGKPGVTDRVFGAWLDALESFETGEIVQVLSAYVRENEFAPKPKNIADLCRRDRDRNRGFAPMAKGGKTADPRIAKAWVICIKRFYGWDVTDANPDIELDFETALMICNREAAKYENPDAIPDAYKIWEVWDKVQGSADQQAIHF